MISRTTVAIPLHDANRWLPVVKANVERLRDHATILISDAVGNDDALRGLREVYAGHANIEFLGPRDIGSGWVRHCNDLLDRAATEYFMWLPQDDEIDADWIDGGENVLDRKPGAILAVGSIVPVDSRLDVPGRIELPLAFADSDLSGRISAGLAAALTGDASHLGLVFRAVMRRGSACRLPEMPASGEWVDVLWALQMLTRGSFESIPEVEYRKRWYANSSHRGWRNMRQHREMREEFIPDSLSDLGPKFALATLASAWSAEFLELQDRLALALAERDRALLASATLRTAFENSRSWRLTRLLRALNPQRRRRPE